MTPRHEKCHSCGGQNEAKTGPGRTSNYRGVECEYPADLAIDTCTNCGSEWVDSADIDIMSKAFEEQRLAAIQSRLQSIEITIKARTEKGATFEATVERVAQMVNIEDARWLQELGKIAELEAKPYNEELLVSMLGYPLPTHGPIADAITRLTSNIRSGVVVRVK